MGNSEMELPIFGDKAIGIRISPKLCEVCYFSIGFIVGKRSTSRMEALSVSNITNRSTPNPRPPVGGRPYSNAVI